MTARPRLGWLCVALALVVACSSSTKAAPASSTAATPALVPTPSAVVSPAQPAAAATTTPAPSAFAQPDGARILERDRHLAVDIGPRVAGSGKEKEAADFLAGELRSFGYAIELQKFSSSTATGRETTLSVFTKDLLTVPNVPFGGSSEGNVRAPLVVSGGGAAGDFPASARGAIALVQRGAVLFRDMLTNATAAGVAGMIVVNNVPGTFFGTLESQATIPVVAVSQTDGLSLTNALAGGPLDGQLIVIDDSISENVVARPPGSPGCDTVTGGHYDTVLPSPGGNDNGSGTATVVEIAGVIAARNEMRNNCFVLFAAEEPGLLGSQAFVADMDPAARARLKVMLDFDMTAVLTGSAWELYSSPQWLNLAQATASAQQVPAQAITNTKMRADSDHWSFFNAGLPIVWLFAGNDTLIHTPKDTIDRAQPQLMEQAARFGVAFLEAVGAGN